MKVYLCGSSGCCPSLETINGTARIGEEGNLYTLSEDQWNALVDEITIGGLGRVERVA
ncbi:MAG: hypothetical protein KGI38_03740 [Thaumarchaeota archaeon]|nr:hypothetical protein [Nitrososphaerota archaeon]